MNIPHPTLHTHICVQNPQTPISEGCLLMNNTSKALQGQVMQYGELVRPSVAPELDEGGEQRKGGRK